MKHLTRRGFLSAAAVAAAAAAGCDVRTVQSIGFPATRPTGISDIPNEDVEPRPPALPATRPGDWVRYNFTRVRPTEFTGDLLNPHIGTATFQRFNGDPVNQNNSWDDTHGPEIFPAFAGNLKNQRYPDTTVAYCRWVWSVLEPQRGKYRWDLIDGALKSAAERGQTLQVRLQPYIARNTIPAWYWTMGGTDARRNGEPDHNNPVYCDFFGSMIRDFGKHFDGHPALESFDIAYGGVCGEGGGNASPETAAKLVDIYVESLPRTQLIAMMGTPGCIYAMKLDRPIGWRVDCFGDMRTEYDPDGKEAYRWNHMHDLYPREPREAHAVDQWKIAPVVLETCWTVGYWMDNHWDIDWILEQGLKYHPSVFMPKSCYIPDAWQEKIAAFNRRLGYRFVLRQFDLPAQVRAGQPVRMSVWIDNVGVAPIYRPYKLALRYRQGDTTVIAPFAPDIRKWLLDNNWFVEHPTIPTELKPGTAQVDMAIVDDKGQPRVKMAIEGIGKDGWHPMCPLEILPPV